MIEDHVNERKPRLQTLRPTRTLRIRWIADNPTPLTTNGRSVWRRVNAVCGGLASETLHSGVCLKAAYLRRWTVARTITLYEASLTVHVGRNAGPRRQDAIGLAALLRQGVTDELIRDVATHQTRVVDWIDAPSASALNWAGLFDKGATGGASFGRAAIDT